MAGLSSLRELQGANCSALELHNSEAITAACHLLVGDSSIRCSKPRSGAKYLGGHIERGPLVYAALDGKCLRHLVAFLQDCGSLGHVFASVTLVWAGNEAMNGEAFPGSDSWSQLFKALHDVTRRPRMVTLLEESAWGLHSPALARLAASALPVVGAWPLGTWREGSADVRPLQKCRGHIASTAWQEYVAVLRTWMFGDDFGTARVAALPAPQASSTSDVGRHAEPARRALLAKLDALLSWEDCCGQVAMDAHVLGEHYLDEQPWANVRYGMQVFRGLHGRVSHFYAEVLLPDGTEGPTVVLGEHQHGR